MSTVPIFVDDADLPTTSFSGTGWTQQTGKSQTYGGTVTVGQATTGGAGTFALPSQLTSFFAGTDLFMYGTYTSGVAATYTVDFGQPRTMTFSSTTPGKPGAELWRLTGLDAAYHTITITPTAGELTIDYFTYTPTSLTLLSGNDMVLDDQHDALKYSSGWVSTTNEQYPSGTPYLRTTTGTGTKGSTMEVNFVGASVAVYGALQQVDGTLSVSFSVDDGSPTIYKPWNGTQTNSSAWFVSQQMFQQTLSSGSHTLRVLLEDATGSQKLWLDSILFEATSATTIANAAGGSGFSSGSGAASGTTGLGGVGSFPTFGTTVPTFSPPTFAPTETSHSGLSGGAIGGIVSGVVVPLLGILIFVLRRCCGPRQPAPQPSPTPMVQTIPSPTTYTPSPVHTPPNTGPPPNLHQALANMMNQHQQGPQTPNLQTNWDTDDLSSNPTQPSHQGSTSNLRNWNHHGSQV